MKCHCSRRDFLVRGMYGIGVGGMLPMILSRTSAALSAQALQGTSVEKHPNRILVVIELSGGNDGLNTVVPFGDAAYYRARPELGIAEREVIKAADGFGFHPSMVGFERLYKDGRLAVVREVDGQRRLESLVGLCQRLSRLIDDLLTYSQIGRTEPEAAPIDLNEIVADVIDTLGAAIDERNAIVRVKGSLPTVEADRVLVGEVFRNLIANALKFNESPQPTVEIGHEGGALYVRDNGIGIPECHHEAVFTMFRRLHSRRKYEGTGAGLTFVRKIVEAHGGSVWLESQPECGATFYFTLSAEPVYAGQEPARCTVG